MIKVLLCAEGVSDAGSPRDSGDGYDEGWLQGAVRKVLNVDISFSVKSRRELVLLPRAARKHRPLPAGHGAKALLAKVIASSEGVDKVVFMVDADTSSRSEWRARRTEINRGFDAVVASAKGVACVPKATSESWLLSDEDAWLQCGLEDADCLPKRPEEQWGRRSDPDGNHPHQQFSRICQSANLSDSRDTRVRLIEKTTVESLREKCPLSFGAFETDLKAD